jgi:hypothetical protein
MPVYMKHKIRVLLGDGMYIIWYLHILIKFNICGLLKGQVNSKNDQRKYFIKNVQNSQKLKFYVMMYFLNMIRYF